MGNVLIVQQDGTPDPDDHFLSDSLNYYFSTPVFIKSMIALDYEGPQAETGAGVFMYDADGVLLTFVPFDEMLGNDNSLEEINLLQPGVSALKVYYGSAIPSSGGVAQICFSNIAPPELEFTDCTEVDTVTSQTTITPVDACTSIITQTISVTDVCGNEDTDACVREITIESDGLTPEIECPADITLGCNDPVPAPDPSSVSVSDNCSDPSDIFVTFVEDIVEGTGCDEVIRRIYSATDTCGNEGLCVQFITRMAPPQVQVSAMILLEASVDSTGSAMTATINSLLPSDQPYYMAPYGYTGPESCPTFPPEIVDWVLMELRDPVTMDVMSRRSALLKEDGNIVDLDGVSPVMFDVTPDWYYLAVCHRNHLDVITDLPIDMTGGTGSCNFSTEGNPNGMIEVSAGTFALMMGDVNGDHQVKYNGANNDKNEILGAVGLTTPNNIVAGYNRFDVNMDGVVKYNGANNDKNVILQEVGLTTPNNIVIGQMNGM